MQVQRIPFETTQSFNQFFIDFVNQKESLKPFYHHYPTVQNFKAQIAEKTAFDNSRFIRFKRVQSNPSRLANVINLNDSASTISEI